MKVFNQEFLLLWRSAVVRLILGGYLLTCFIAVFNGAHTLTSESDNYQQIESYFKRHSDRWQEKLAAQTEAETEAESAMGSLAYYSFMPTWHQPSPWSGLFRGERDDYNAAMRLRLLALQGQLQDSEMQNYQHAPFGALDLAFIWVYVLPLLIGALSVNVLADDRESGRWPLIASAITSPFKLIFARLSVRFALLYGLNLLVLLAAVLSIPGIALYELAAVAALLLLYQLVWFAVAGWIVGRRQSGRNNIIYFCGLWIFIAFLIPGMAYLDKMNAEDLDNGIEAVVQQRETMNSSWDRDKQKAFTLFLQKHPEWSDTATLPEAFHWKWYYAMQQLSDDKVEDVVAKRRRQRIDNYEINRKWSWGSPVLGFHSALTRIADTDALAYQSYLDQLAAYHSDLQQFYFPFLFFTASFTPDQIQNIPRFQYQPGSGETASGAAGTMSAMALFIVLIAWRFNRWL